MDRPLSRLLDTLKNLLRVVAPVGISVDELLLGNLFDPGGIWREGSGTNRDSVVGDEGDDIELRRQKP